jgi:rubrerythrin
MGTSTQNAGLALADVLDLAVSMERSAENIYSAAAAGMSDLGLRRLLVDMASTEHEHADTWQRERDSLSPGVVQEASDADGVVSAYLATWLARGPLAKAKLALPLLDAAATPHDILATALRMETEAIAFYSALEDFVCDGATRRQVRRVLGDERKHATDIMTSMHRHAAGSK